MDAHFNKLDTINKDIYIHGDFGEKCSLFILNNYVIYNT